MNITIETLRAFRAAAETQSFTRAAEQMYMTQPAFSRLMSGLEKEWSIKLFERTTRKVELTQGGQACYITAVRMLDQYEQMLTEVEKIKRTFNGELKIGCNAHSGLPDAFVQAMRGMKREYPGIRLSMQSAGSNDLVPMVENGSLDCALAWSKSVSSFEHLGGIKIELTHKYAILPAVHPLAEKETVSLRDLVGIPMIFLKERETRTYQMVTSHCQDMQIVLMEAAPAKTFDEMMMRVSIGGEGAISSFVYSDHYFRDVIFRPIADLDQEEINGWRMFLWRKDTSNEGVTVLARLLEQQLHAGDQE